MDQIIAALASLQHGVFTRQQARDAGFSSAAVARRLRSGRWIEVTPRVFRIAGFPVSDESTVMATVLSAGTDGVASGLTTLALHGVRDTQLLPALVVVGRRPHRLALPGVTETFRLPERHREVVNGIPSATPARALFDLAGTTGVRALARRVDAALAARVVTIPSLLEVLDDLAERGRAGTRNLREVVADRLDAYEAPTSHLESRFLEMLADFSLPRPEMQVGLGGRLGWIGTVDFVWRRERVIVETDGSTFHDSVTDREYDERRDRALEDAGWTVLRFGWHDVTRRPTSVVRTLQRALALAA